MTTTTGSDLDALIAAEDANIAFHTKAKADLLVQRIAADLRTWRPEGGILDVKIIWGNFDQWNDVKAKIVDRDGNQLHPTVNDISWDLVDGRYRASVVLHVAEVPKRVNKDLETLEGMFVDPGQIHF